MHHFPILYREHFGIKSTAEEEEFLVDILAAAEHILLQRHPIR